jgi:hypothetical protein
MEENEFECPRCGERVYYELGRCPNCGLNFYNPEDEPDDWRQRWSGPQRVPGISLIAIAAGWAISGMVAVLAYIALNQVFRAGLKGQPGWIFIMGSTALGSFVGAYLAGRISSYRPILQGLIVGGLNLGFVILLDAYNRNLVIGNIIRWQTLVAWGLTALAGLAGGRLISWQEMRGIERLFFPEDREEELYQDLLAKVGYDREIVERLVEYERKRDPGAPRTVLLKNAIERWERDNR